MIKQMSETVTIKKVIYHNLFFLSRITAGILVRKAIGRHKNIIILIIEK